MQPLQNFCIPVVQPEGELTACDEGELRWVEKDEVLSLPLWEGDREFLRLLREDAPFFSLKLVYQGDKLVSSKLAQ